MQTTPAAPFTTIAAGSDGRRGRGAAAAAGRAREGRALRTPDQIPVADRARALEQREAQLERHLEHCRAILDGGGLNPPVGRELDDTRATLAHVRAELAQIAARC